MPKNFLIYNENCPFCNRTALWLKRIIKRRLVIIPNWDRKRIKRVCGLAGSYDFTKDVHFIRTGKEVEISSAGGAVANCLGLIGLFSFVPSLYKHFLFKLAIDVGYNILKKYKQYL